VRWRDRSKQERRRKRHEACAPTGGVGKDLPLKLRAACQTFNTADTGLRSVVETVNDEQWIGELAAIEKREGPRTIRSNLTIQTPTCNEALK
jgi:hypothetical protein